MMQVHFVWGDWLSQVGLTCFVRGFHLNREMGMAGCCVDSLMRAPLPSAGSNLGWDYGKHRLATEPPRVDELGPPTLQKKVYPYSNFSTGEPSEGEA